jgi:hypothetical protein
MDLFRKILVYEVRKSYFGVPWKLEAMCGHTAHTGLRMPLVV